MFIAFVVIISFVVNKYYKIYMKDSFNKEDNNEEDGDENNKKNLLNRNRKFEKENNEDAKEMDIIK